jgi:hypothetical protein
MTIRNEGIYFKIAGFLFLIIDIALGTILLALNKIYEKF